MRSLILLGALFSPALLAQTVIEVEPHSFMRLPSNSSVLLLERLEIADHGTLLIPPGLTELRVAELRLGRDARIAIAPAEQALRLEVAQGEIASGAQISARGAQGTLQQPASPGRTLSIRLQALVTESLLVDACGGAGASGYAGLDGADGQAGGCTWGQAERGHDGQDGGDGQSGAAGARVRLELPADFPAQSLQLRLEGGAGGPAGKAGNGGQGLSKGCWLYSTQAAGAGRPGQAGKPGAQGPAGAVDLVRF
ncbi:MAG TPA: collagen-like protein [Pseudomonas sp.]|nr:collagen-like protein [Pseudomonas sp.]